MRGGVGVRGGERVCQRGVSGCVRGGYMRRRNKQMLYICEGKTYDMKSERGRDP